MKKAIFFDRDGVINYRIVKDYVKKIEEFHFIPDFLYFFEQIKNLDYLLIVITNQQGVKKGKMTEYELNQVLNFMQNQLNKKFNRNFDDIFYCTDLADSGSFCRKPNPGMILEAKEKWNIDLENSWLIGDSLTDVVAGKRAGLKTILIGKYDKNDIPDADFIVKDFYDLQNKIKF